LNSLSPRPTQVQVSTDAKCVTVCHPDQLSVHSIRESLTNAGFGVSTNGALSPILSRSNSRSAPSTSNPPTELTMFGKGELPRNTVGADFLVRGSDILFTPGPQDTKGENLRVILSVGGMSCASCATAITDALENVQGVSQPAVNLLGRSATMIVDRREVVDTAVNAVIDCGYTAEVFRVVPIAENNKPSGENLRTVSLRVDGLFCP
jgi:P-type Cu+ transporter